MSTGKFGIERPFVNEFGEGPLGVDRLMVESEEVFSVDVEDVPISEKRRLFKERNIKI